MKPPRSLSVILAGLALSWAGSASAYKPDMLRGLVDTIKTATPVSMPAAGPIEMGFPPKGGAETLVLRVIDPVKIGVKVLSYSSTSPRTAVALLRVAKREVVVSLVADYKNNITDDQSGRGWAALSVLAEAGYDVRAVSAYPIHHDKVLTVGRQTVELGSFNYSDAVARVNSENVPVNWNNPTPAKAYLARFDCNWRQLELSRTRY